MPSARRQKKAAPAGTKRAAPKHRPPAKAAARPKPRKPSPGSSKPAPPKSAGNKPAAKSGGADALPSPPLEIPLPGGRRHLLSLSFVRDGDEFLARLETDGGHITELKNRSLDQLLTLVASELEDLLE